MIYSANITDAFFMLTKKNQRGFSRLQFKKVSAQQTQLPVAGALSEGHLH